MGVDQIWALRKRKKKEKKTTKNNNMGAAQTWAFEKNKLNENKTWECPRFPHLWVAALGVLGDAVTLLHAVGPPGERWTRQVTGGTEPPRPALADAEDAVAVASGALLEAEFVTGLAEVARGAAVLTILSLHTRRADALASDVVAGAAVLTGASAHAVAAFSVGTLV